MRLVLDGRQKRTLALGAAFGELFSCSGQMANPVSVIKNPPYPPVFYKRLHP